MTTVTLRTHQSQKMPPGFNHQMMQIPYVRYDDTLKTVIDNLNQYRSPEAQIMHLYNPLGQEILPHLWGFKIKEKMTFYIDQPF
jgi:hypothetical protein